MNIEQMTYEEIVNEISPSSNNSADHDIEFARRILAARDAQWNALIAGQAEPMSGEAQAVLSEIRSSARALAAIPAAHSNADLAAKARSLAESHDSIADVRLSGSPTFVSQNLGNLARNTADTLREIAIALEAPITQQAGGVPAGFLLVPWEPTPEMVKAAEYYLDSTPHWITEAYRAMLAAPLTERSAAAQ